ncbi:hypothetical protein Veis_2094 [Verminephrobacter eiseniae EF01-2]|uniref:Uncharacterized protein n=1 Tax=Verminephrobacter eiseniae (strain EF01-2) TaxID=391735 RepID=A1WJN7_VEREI|nr:hypothetical protein Veis_2094 [Verminephrobacter eiseniae EF01-2]
MWPCTKRHRNLLGRATPDAPDTPIACAYGHPACASMYDTRQATHRVPGDCGGIRRVRGAARAAFWRRRSALARAVAAMAAGRAGGTGACLGARRGARQMSASTRRCAATLRASGPMA